MNGRFSFKKYGTEFYMLNSVPTMIEEGKERLLVFSHTPKKLSKEEPHWRFFGGPALYFYNFEEGAEKFRIKGGEALVNYSPSTTDEKGVKEKGRLMFLGNAWVMKENKFWGSSYNLHPSEDVKIYEDSVNVEKN